MSTIDLLSSGLATTLQAVECSIPADSERRGRPKGGVVEGSFLATRQQGKVPTEELRTPSDQAFSHSGSVI